MPYHADPWLTVYQGDCREVMAAMEPQSVHCVVTSPPYWGLRDYGTATWIGGDEGCDHAPKSQSLRTFNNGQTTKQYETTLASWNKRDVSAVYLATCDRCGAIREDKALGLEPTPEEYVANMVDVFREVRRVLRDDGTVWLNIGDSYASGGERSTGRNDTDRETPGGRGGSFRGGERHPTGQRDGLKPKDLVGIPWRVAFALQADGWYLRSDIIWAKPNPMPESVTDRPTKAHEYVFLLTKSARYWYDAEAVREPAEYGRSEWRGDQWASSRGERGGYSVVAGDGSSGRNLRSVWSIATQPYPGAHFATFPEKLVEPCIKAGCPDRVCSECGAGWGRLTERPTPTLDDTRGPKWAGKADGIPRRSSFHVAGWRDAAPDISVTTGWRPTCAHDAATVPGTVLDPFGGSGTTGRVAQRLSRRAVLIDLNAEYLVQAMGRNREIPLGLEAG